MMMTAESFNRLIVSAKKIAQDLEIDCTFPLVRKRKAPKIFPSEQSTLTGISATDDPEEKYKLEFFFAILKTTLDSIKERFSLLQQHGEDFRIIRELHATKDLSDEILLESCKNLQTN